MVRLVVILFIIVTSKLSSADSSCKAHFKQAAKLYEIPNGILQTVSLIEARKHPWTINVKGKGYYFKTKEYAVAYVSKLIKAGHKNIDIGCMQINYKFHGSNFSSIEEMFEPETNVTYAARFLSQNFKEFKDWRRAIAVFHSREETLGQVYLGKFLRDFHTFN
ncbi:MAG: transglycosylase SLT domain-containing protein [Sphingobacteriia bacterium]|nr:transglycosylase SLT domain-containing protein [Sphingobacteriia bacterium]